MFVEREIKPIFVVNKVRNNTNYSNKTLHNYEHSRRIEVLEGPRVD